MIDLEKAKEIAHHTLRFEIGTAPFIDNVQCNADNYAFDIMYTYTELPAKQNDDVVFYKPQKIGELQVFSTDDVSYTNTDKLYDNIKQIKQQAQNGNIDTV